MTQREAAGDPPDMLLHGFWERGETLFHDASHGALAALAAVLVAWALAKRAPLRPAARQAIGGLAVAAGLIAGFAVDVGPAALRWRGPSDRLPILVLGLFAAGFAADRLRASRARLGLLAIAALAGGWWLAGAPAARPDRSLVIEIVASAALVGGIGVLVQAARGPWAVIAATFALWAGLHLAGAARPAEFALVAVAASLGLLIAPRGRLQGLWPMAGMLAGIGAIAILTSGHLARGGFDRVDWAAPAPLFALLFVLWLRRRGWSDGGAGTVAALAVVLLVWMAGGVTR